MAKRTTKKRLVRKTRKSSKKPELYPLSNGFMLFGLFGAIFSLLAYDTIGPAWSISFSIIFGSMFVASIISITPKFPKY